MNERIRELFDQAHKEFSEEHKFSTVLLPNPLKQKFAELIIAECCVALHPMLRDMISRTQGVDMIVKHFGDSDGVAE